MTRIHRIAVILLAILLSGLVAPATAQAAPNPPLGTTITWAGNTSRVTIVMDECGDIGVGTRGSCVASLQTWLNTFNSAGLVVDGDFGESTRQAVLNYQRARGIDPVGVVRDQTRRALAADYNQRSNFTDARFPDTTRPHFIVDAGIITHTVYLSRAQSLKIKDALEDGATVGASIGSLCATVAGLTPVGVLCGALGAAGGRLRQVLDDVEDDPETCLALKFGTNHKGVGGVVAKHSAANCQVA